MFVTNLLSTRYQSGDTFLMLIFMIALHDGHYHSHFVDEETEV